MPPRRSSRPTPPAPTELALTARIVARPPAAVTQAQLTADLEVSEQTIRTWARRGMPVHGTPARPVYHWGEVNVWLRYFQHLQRRGTAPRLVSFERACWHARLDEAPAFGDEMGEHFVIVPLSWDHPGREAALRRACAGREPDDLPEDSIR
jgi:hypothetical protein